MSKPRVTLKCPANVHTSPNERIIEFSFPDGTGGLISFTTTTTGPRVEVYRCDPSVVVVAPAS